MEDFVDDDLSRIFGKLIGGYCWGKRLIMDISRPKSVRDVVS